MKLILFLLISVCAITKNLSADERESEVLRLSSQKFKVFWYLPLASSISPEKGWFEVMYCRDGNRIETCNQLYKRIPVGQLSNRGQLKLQIDFEGVARLLFESKTPQKDTAVLAAYQVGQEGWFPRMEICRSRFQAVECDYEIQFFPNRNPAEVELKIYFQGNQ